MSYCRWSSDNWQCDVYCYESADGFTTHVAGNKTVEPPPDDQWADFVAGRITPEEFGVKHQAAMDFLETAERKPIGLPYDGQSFSDPDLESFLARLLHLKETGYNVPEFVINNVREEITEDQP